ncbi:hypothetical protein EGW08_004525, partial [Elysia chlorotica]
MMFSQDFCYSNTRRAPSTFLTSFLVFDISEQVAIIRMARNKINFNNIVTRYNSLRGLGDTEVADSRLIHITLKARDVTWDPPYMEERLLLGDHKPGAQAISKQNMKDNVTVTLEEGLCTGKQLKRRPP